MVTDEDDPKLLHISWGNVHNGAKVLSEQIRKAPLPDVVIARQEDVIAASLVSIDIEIPLCIVHLKDRIDGIILDCIPKITKPIRSGVYEQPSLPSVLIISTLIENERNVDDIISYYEKRGHNVTTMCIYSRKNVEHKPDYHWVNLFRTVKYIFPWDEE